ELQNAPKDAIVEFHKALYLQPNNATTHKNLDGIIDYMGKDPASFKVRVELAEEALGKEDKVGAFIEYKQALAIKEDPAVRAKFDEVARALDANYRPVSIAGSTNSSRQIRNEGATAAEENTPGLFSSVPGWAAMLAAMAAVFVVGLYAGS